MAHPERSRGFSEGGLARLGPLSAGGARIATNVGPLTGRESEARWLAARDLMRDDAIDVVATDAHPPARPYQLADVAAIAGDRHARLTADAPGALLRDGIARR